MEEKSLFWADQIARMVLERCKKDPKLKAIVKKQGYLIYDEKTPSGKIHVGSGRGWIIHDAIAKAMRDAGMKGCFVLSSDDIDPLDRPTQGVPEKYLGVPLRNIPSPVKGYKSYADYFFRQCTERFGEFGIETKLESTGGEYDRGTFNGAIKIALDNAEKIKQIYSRIYGRTASTEKLPFSPICEKCGKIGTTLAYDWDKKGQVVKYRCMPDLVSWAKGCGHEGETSPYNGKGKLPWKVEWAAKWFSKGVVCELAGKDHFTKGGSRDVAVAVSSQVFDYPPPYPSTRDSSGSGYEFFNMGGRKMSTSKGVGIGFAESGDMLPAKMIRYMLVSSRPGTAIDFDPARENDMILLYDRYDSTERVYFKKEAADEKEYMNQKRIYELSHLGGIPKTMGKQISFLHAVLLSQICKDRKKIMESLISTGQLDKNSGKEEIDYVMERVLSAGRWVERFGGDKYRIAVQESIPQAVRKMLSEKQLAALKELAKLLSKPIKEDVLYKSFFDIAKSHGLEPQEFFRAAYLVIIGKEQGPRLSALIMSADRKGVAGLLEKV